MKRWRHEKDTVLFSIQCLNFVHEIWVIFLALVLWAFHPHHPSYLPVFGVQKFLSGTLHSLNCVLGGATSVGCHAEPLDPGRLGFGLQGPEEAVIDLRTKGSLGQTHHPLLYFSNCLSSDRARTQAFTHIIISSHQAAPLAVWIHKVLCK